MVKRFNWRGWLKVQSALKRAGESGILGLPACIPITVTANVADLDGGVAFFHLYPPKEAPDFLQPALLPTCTARALLTSGRA